MRILITIFLFLGLVKNLFCCCAPDDRTLTEMLFNGQAGTIFTCKILMMTAPKYNEDTLVTSDGGKLYREVYISSDGSNIGTATAQIIQVYFGKVDTNIVTLNTGSFLQIGKTYLIYTDGNSKTFGCGGNCDKWTKQVADNPDSTYEVRLIKQFSNILKNKTTGKLTFTNSKGIVIADGQFKKGKPAKIWKHYYDNGVIKAKYDLEKNITSQYSANGFIKGKSIVNKNVGIYEQYSSTVNGQLKLKDIETKNDTGFVMQLYEYYDNGNLKNVGGQININVQGGCASAGKTGAYEEYYESGIIKLKGQYSHNRRVGLWKWYKDNGEFNTEFDYKDGSGGQ